MATENNGNNKQSQSSPKGPKMPAARTGSQARRGGLGRGLASLIPSGPSKPSLGTGAADVILGQKASPSPTPGNEASRESTPTPESRADSKEKGKRNPSADRVAEPKGPRKPQARDSEASRKSGHGDSSAGSKTLTSGEEMRTADGGVSYDSPTPTKRHSDETAEDFGATYQEIPLGQIRANAKQPRSVFDEDSLKELVHSIREFGLMQPIVVRRANDGETEFELIMGERRLRASKDAGLDTIPAIVRQTDDEAMLRDALLENIHRVQLNPLEEAAAYQQLLEDFGVTQAQLAERLGRSRPLITNMIRLLQLPVAVQRRVSAGVLSAGHARALLGVQTGPEDQENLAKRVVAEGLSVRATEEAVVLLNGQGGQQKRKPKTQRPRDLPSHVSSWVEEFQDALDTKVSVQMGKKKGKLVVEFGGPEDFDRIAEILKWNKSE